MESLTCAHCGIEFQRYLSQIRNPERSFCSREHKSEWQRTGLVGTNNPNYKVGAYVYQSFCHCGKTKDHRANQCSKCSRRGYPKDPTSIIPDEVLLACIPQMPTLKAVAVQCEVGRSRVSELVELHHIDISHMRSSGKSGRRQSPEHILCKGDKRKNGTVKKTVLSFGLLDYLCEICGLAPEWNGSELTLELDHINGDPTNNELKNLRFLCPNCHSQTPTSKGRNTKKARSPK